MKLDGPFCGVPPTAVESTGVFSSSEVEVLPHVNAGIVGARHVKVDVDGVGVEAGGVPFYVKLLASDDVLVHGRRFVEAASLAGYGIGGQMGSEGEMKTVVLTRVGGPFPADMVHSEVRGVGGHYSRKIRDGGENERIPGKGGGLVNDCGLTEGRGREEKPWEDEKEAAPVISRVVNVEP